MITFWPAICGTDLILVIFFDIINVNRGKVYLMLSTVFLLHSSSSFILSWKTPNCYWLINSVSDWMVCSLKQGYKPVVSKPPQQKTPFLLHSEPPRVLHSEPPRVLWAVSFLWYTQSLSNSSKISRGIEHNSVTSPYVMFIFLFHLSQLFCDVSMLVHYHL